MTSVLSSVKESQSIWFIQLRWLAAGLGLAAVLTVWLLFPSFVYPIPLVAMLVILAGLNLVYSWIQSRLHLSTPYFPEKQKKINRLLRAQILGDLIVLFLLLLFSGGLQNPLVFLFLLHIVIASILFPRKQSWKYVLLSMFLPLALFLLAWIGWTPTRLEFLNQSFSFVDETCRLLAFFIVAGGTWFVVSRISEELSGAEGQVRESGEILSRTKMDMLVLESHRNRLLKNLAKELSLPIQAIGTRFGEVEKSVHEGDLSKVLTALQSFRVEIDGLRDISEDLEWLSEPHWHQRDYRKERFDLVVLAAKEVSRKALSALEKNIMIKITGPKKIILNADKQSIQQIINQLLSNAIKYTPAGRGDILLTLEQEVPFAVFSVQDQGVGIPDGEKENLFQEFFRSSNVEKTGTFGSGLGLYIVKEVVDWHRGVIKVESALGQGTKVKVWLPMDEATE